MITRALASVLILSVLFSGCSLYRNYPFERYENSEPRHNVEFIMKDNTVIPVKTSEIALVKNSGDYYSIYFKNGETLNLKKDQIASVRMLDEGRLKAWAAGITVVIGVSLIILIVILFGNAQWGF